MVFILKIRSVSRVATVAGSVNPTCIRIDLPRIAHGHARVARDILPAETEDNSNNSVVNNIQALYLTAVQQAQRAPDPRVVDALAVDTNVSTAKPRNDDGAWWGLGSDGFT
jgi:hypothetical protein